MSDFCKLKDRVALVTGGSRGIGAEISKELARAGARVFINYRSNKEAAEKVLAEVKEFSADSEIIGFDVANAEEVDKATKEILEKTEKIDILVCNAGISKDQLLPRSSAEDFETIIQTNLMGAIHPVRALSRSMMKNRYGRIILIGSVVGQMGNKGQSAYAASKSALSGFAKSVARELGSRGVTCNLIAPGFIETEMTDSLPEEAKKYYFEQIPAQRFGTTSEIASAARFLSSQEAAYITGSCMDVNGGILML